jgi:hypothetical protein
MELRAPNMLPSYFHRKANFNPITGTRTPDPHHSREASLRQFSHRFPSEPRQSKTRQRNEFRNPITGDVMRFDGR